jgi:hypothetical protein
MFKINLLPLKPGPLVEHSNPGELTHKTEKIELIKALDALLSDHSVWFLDNFNKLVSPTAKLESYTVYPRRDFRSQAVFFLEDLADNYVELSRKISDRDLQSVKNLENRLRHFLSLNLDLPDIAESSFEYLSPELRIFGLRARIDFILSKIQKLNQLNHCKLKHTDLIPHECG